MVFDNNEAVSVRNTRLHRWLLLLILPLLSTLAASSSHAQSSLRTAAGTHGNQTITAIQIELPVDVDGSLDDPAWQQAQVSLGFVQKDPQEGEASTERTEFRVLYTATTLYVGVVCYDSGAGGILATERRRDNNLENDDTITILLDTFHDHRNSFLFRTNPLGTQYDAQITDEGNDVNENWDEKWDVASQVSPVGWTAEFAIPFKSLRVSEKDGQGWGLDLERVIRRKNEFAYWNGFRRGFNLENVSQAGHLEGLKNIETGLRLRVKPFSVAGFRQSSDRSRSTLRNTSDIGMEVLKYRITSGLTADMTWNTDFAQTEVDNQQVNLDRFSLFFPEKREFFLEGAGVYEFGVATGEQPNVATMKLFHSRRIGLAGGQPVPIVAGGRITGKLQGLTLGLLNVQTEALPSEGVPASNYGVLRVKRDVLSRSMVGGFLINREKGGSSDFNRVYGMDANFVFFRHLTIEGLLGKSSSPGVKGDNWVSNGAIDWDSDFLHLGTSWLVVDPNFRDDVGFIPRKNIRQLSPQFAIKPRPSSRLIRQFMFRFRSDYTMNQRNELETRVNHHTFEIRFQSGDVLLFSPHSRLERLREPFEIRPDVVIPPGTYSWWYNGIRYMANPARKLSGVVFWRYHYGFFGGDHLNSLILEPRLRLSEQLSVETRYELSDAAFPQGEFIDHTIDTRVNYNFNNQWLTSTTIQYNSVDSSGSAIQHLNSNSFWGVNFRLNYIFRPGDDFFLIYNEGRRDQDLRLGPAFDLRKDRSLQLKLTYSLDF